MVREGALRDSWNVPDLVSTRPIYPELFFFFYELIVLTDNVHKLHPVQIFTELAQRADLVSKSQCSWVVFVCVCGGLEPIIAYKFRGVKFKYENLTPLAVLIM